MRIEGFGGEAQSRPLCGFGGCARGEEEEEWSLRGPSLGSALLCGVSLVHHCPFLGLCFLTGQMRTVKEVMDEMAKPSSRVGAPCTVALLNFLKRF